MVSITLENSSLITFFTLLLFINRNFFSLLIFKREGLLDRIKALKSMKPKMHLHYTMCFYNYGSRNYTTIDAVGIIDNRWVEGSNVFDFIPLPAFLICPYARLVWQVVTRPGNQE